MNIWLILPENRKNSINFVQNTQKREEKRKINLLYCPRKNVKINCHVVFLGEGMGGYVWRKLDGYTYG